LRFSRSPRIAGIFEMLKNYQEYQKKVLILLDRFAFTLYTLLHEYTSCGHIQILFINQSGIVNNYKCARLWFSEPPPPPIVLKRFYTPYYTIYFFRYFLPYKEVTRAYIHLLNVCLYYVRVTGYAHFLTRGGGVSENIIEERDRFRAQAPPSFRRSGSEVKHTVRA
jgi:hypothetical protein